MKSVYPYYPQPCYHRSLRVGCTCSLSAPRGLEKDLLSLPTKSLTICVSIWWTASCPLGDIPERWSCHNSVPLSSHYDKYHLTFDKSSPFFSRVISQVLYFYPQNSTREGKVVLISPFSTDKNMERNKVVFQNLIHVRAGSRILVLHHPALAYQVLYEDQEFKHSPFSARACEHL